MPLILKGTVKPGQPDKRYYMIRVQVDGRREVLSSGTRDRKLAEKKEQAVVDALQKDIDTPKVALLALIRGDSSAAVRSALRETGRMTIAEAEKRCFSDPNVWGRIRTQGTYRANLKHLKDFLGADKAVADIRSSDLVDLVKHLLDKERKPGGIDRILAATSKLIKSAHGWTDDPFKLPKIPFLNESQPRRWELSPEMETPFFEAILAAPRANGGLRGCLPDYGPCVDLFKFLLDTGMRLGEAQKLRWDDIKTRNGVTMLRLWRRDSLKTDASVRTVPATPRACEILERLRGTPVGPFIGLSKAKVQRAWDAGRKAMEITDKDCVIHGLRHTCGTRLLEATGDIRLVQEWLGHENITTTAKVYAHVPTHRLIGAAEALSKLSGTQPQHAE